MAGGGSHGGPGDLDEPVGAAARGSAADELAAEAERLTRLIRAAAPDLEQLLDATLLTPAQLRQVNALCRLVEMATVVGCPRRRACPLTR